MSECGCDAFSRVVDASELHQQHAALYHQCIRTALRYHAHHTQGALDTSRMLNVLFNHCLESSQFTVNELLMDSNQGRTHFTMPPFVKLAHQCYHGSNG